MYNQREREGASEWIAIPDGRTAYKAKEQKRQEEDICIRNTKTAKDIRNTKTAKDIRNTKNIRNTRTVRTIRTAKVSPLT